MSRIVVIVVVIIVLLGAVGAGLYFFGPDELKQQIGLGEPTPVPEGPAPTPTEDPGVDIVVAKIDLPIGTYITDTQALLDVENISTLRYEERAEMLFREAEIGKIREMVLDVPLFAGDPLEKDFLSLPGLSQRIPTPEPDRPRPKAFPLEVDKYTGVGDQIMVGDSVDVVATFVMQRTIYNPPEKQQVGPGSGGAEQEAPEPVDGEEEAPPVDQTGSSTILPSLDDNEEWVRSKTTQEFFSTKTIVQRAKVLAILRPPPPTPVPVSEEDQQPEEEDAEEAPPPTATPEDGGPPTTVTEGTWQVVLALNDQQTEIISFAQLSGAELTLVLRGAGDNVHEETLGATFDLMLSEFGLPMPEPYKPYIYPVEVLQPEPTRTPAPEIRIP